MINDIKNSFDKILYERLTSPFYGSILISWVIWNWKIIYLTFFIDEKNIEVDKITYITENFYSFNNLFIYPVISTFFIVLIMPFVTNSAYWVSLHFNQWKVKKRNTVQQKELLTIEQSIQLRKEILESERKLDTLLQSKNDEIKQLKLLLDQTKKANKVPTPDFAQIYQDAKNEDQSKLKTFKSRDDALKELGPDREFYYAQGNLDGVPSPGGKTIHRT